MEVCNEVMLEFHKAIIILQKCTSIDLKKNWITLIKRQIILFITLIKKDIPHGHKVSIQTNLGHLKTYKTILERSIIGRGLISKRSDRVK